MTTPRERLSKKRAAESDDPKRCSRRPGAFLLDQNDQVWINYVNHWVDLKHTEGFFDELATKWGLQ